MSIQKCPPFKVRVVVWVIYGCLAAPPAAQGANVGVFNMRKSFSEVVCSNARK